MTLTRLSWAALIVAAACAAASCAKLGGLGAIVQPPSFEQAEGREAELRLFTPSLDRPVGGAGVRVWLEVTNPNTFGFTLSAVRATLMLEGTRAATGDFPLGLPLRAREATVVPLDLSISFSDLPDLSGTLRRIAIGGVVPYALDGTVTVDAGRLGQPSFGPMRLTTGELRVAR
jgi:hypothetical protein